MENSTTAFINNDSDDFIIATKQLNFFEDSYKCAYNNYINAVKNKNLIITKQQQEISRREALQLVSDINYDMNIKPFDSELRECDNKVRYTWGIAYEYSKQYAKILEKYKIEEACNNGQYVFVDINNDFTIKEKAEIDGYELINIEDIEEDDDFHSIIEFNIENPTTTKSDNVSVDKISNIQTDKFINILNWTFV